MIGRRGFVTGLISLVAAPAIVRAGSLMPVKSLSLRSVITPAQMGIDLSSWTPSTAYGYADLIQYRDGFLKIVPTWVLDDLR